MMQKLGSDHMSKTKPFSWLTLNILVLGFVSFLADVSSKMVFSLLPFFMTSVLGIEMHLVGLIKGAAEATASLLKVFSGWFSDKFKKRKPFALLGYSISTVLKPLFAFATSTLHVFAIRISERVGKGIRTSPRDALISDSVQAEVRGKAYGLHRSMDTLGAVVGPLIAFFYFHYFARGVERLNELSEIVYKHATPWYKKYVDSLSDVEVMRGE